MRISRATIVHVILLLFAAALIAQAARVQLIQGKDWAKRAERQHFRSKSVVAARGNIFDASGNPLAASREVFVISVARNEIKDVALVTRELKAAGVKQESIAAAFDKGKKWVTLPGQFFSADVASLIALPGIHAESVMSREYETSEGIRRIVGFIDPNGHAAGGIEQALDTVLRGDSGVAEVARDVRGRAIGSLDEWQSRVHAGSNITLTINRDLQDICERALIDAVDSLGATGGDIIVMNPMNGEVLAMAGLRRGEKSFSITAITEPFEPGSTMKPFIAAGLFEKNRARVTDVVDTHSGEWKIADRTIYDLHPAKSMALADVIRYSSNIGIAQFGERLRPQEKFEMYRDLGLGAPTGVPLPGESMGTLREPRRWNETSSMSLSMGYEVAVTPLQLVTAYAVLANGGELLQPQVIKEIRSPDGTLLYEGKKRVIRRVFSEQATAQVRKLLEAVVDSGTAVKADLASFQVAGKSGTARRTEAGKGYIAGSYTASFVGVFPADKPQYVVLVKIDSPKRSIYGGDVAAPVSAIILRAAIAARNAALDRSKLASVERDLPLGAAAPRDTVRATAESVRIAAAPAPVAEPEAQALRLVTLPFTRTEKKVDRSERPVPDVAGLPVRAAVRALHQAGFRVTLAAALPTPTVPSAGSILPAGSIVKLQHTQ
jgi:cell division protein FtsI (penicillin-binding protein 3)